MSLCVLVHLPKCQFILSHFDFFEWDFRSDCAISRSSLKFTFLYLQHEKCVSNYKTGSVTNHTKSMLQILITVSSHDFIYPMALFLIN